MTTSHTFGCGLRPTSLPGMSEYQQGWPPVSCHAVKDKGPHLPPRCPRTWAHLPYPFSYAAQHSPQNEKNKRVLRVPDMSLWALNPARSPHRDSSLMQLSSMVGISCLSSPMHMAPCVSLGEEERTFKPFLSKENNQLTKRAGIILNPFHS